MFSSKLSFIMTAVGAAVGLGNIFRFPALCVKYGAPFILVYIMSLLVLGLPLLFSEIAFGRRFGQTAPECFKNADKKALPLSLFCSANSFIIVTYYCVLFSFTVLASVFSYRLFSLSPSSAQNVFTPLIFPNSFSPVLVCFLIFSWAAALLCFGGAKRLGKISTASVIFASSVIFLLSLISIFTSKGTVFSFLKFSFSVFALPSFWLDTLGQVFFSLSLSVGVLITYGACLDKKENIIKCGFWIAFFDLLISLAATVIFVAVDADGSGGLLSSFSAYPKAFASFGVFSAPICFLFYLSVGFLCLDSVFSYLKSAVSFFVFTLGGKELFWAVGVSSVSGVLGLFMLQGEGLKFLNLLDGSIAPFLILLAGLLHTVLFSRGAVKSALLLELGLRKNYHLRVFSLLVGLFCPTLILVLLIAQIFF